MSWILDKIKALFAAKYINSASRQLLAVIAGTLLALKIPKEQVDVLIQALDPVLLGALTYAVSQLWSFLDKKKNQ